MTVSQAIVQTEREGNYRPGPTTIRQGNRGRNNNLRRGRRRPESYATPPEAPFVAWLSWEDQEAGAKCQ
jgi:hypothetical protein